MKKTEKGMPGYLNYKRKIEIIRTLAYFGIVIAILLLGYFQTGTKLNLLTVVAIVGCLPAVSYTHLDVYKRQLYQRAM